VAGRPGERSAADTAATALPPTSAPIEPGAAFDSKAEQDPDRASAKGKSGGEKGEDGYRPPDEEPSAAGPTITRFAVTPAATFAVPIEEMVRAALGERMPGCYRSLLDAVPGIGGPLTLTLTIDAAGELTATATSFSPVLDQCARAAVANLPLGHAADAAGRPVAVTVVVEIQFSPG
jgi:hypothetical protein